MSRLATNTRDVALHRLRRANHWLVGGSLALTALFSEVAAGAFPGRTVGAPNTGGSHSHTGRDSSRPANGSTTSPKPLQPPAQAPRSSTTEAAPPGESAPAHESTPAGESAPAHESAPPAQEPTPTHESTPTQEPAPAQQSAPPQESTPAPAQESAPAAPAPVVSGGS